MLASKIRTIGQDVSHEQTVLSLAFGQVCQFSRVNCSPLPGFRDAEVSPSFLLSQPGTHHEKDGSSNRNFIPLFFSSPLSEASLAQVLFERTKEEERGRGVSGQAGA